MNLDAIENRLEGIHKRYNADNDCSPDYPTVNWTDEQLADCIEGLVGIIESLIKRIEELENKGLGENIALNLPSFRSHG